ncbi:MAG: elongation factor 4, partial [Cyclobacteriaceae bacterium]|nr:elongation factor 4 [Cyclobacteriaceae bacterium]
CGFLGMLHMDIVQERLEREFDMTVITTVPSVQFRAVKTDGNFTEVNAPSEMPEPNTISHIDEPSIRAQIITKADYIGPIIALCIDKRGIIKNQVYLTSDRVELTFELPLAEIVFDFYDRLKTISRGYASLDYELIGYQQSNMIKLDIMLNGDKVDALSAIVHRDKAYDWGKRLCEKLRKLIPRQMFDIAIQASIGTKIIARESVKALRKNVLAKCYGGDITRKRKLLEKQKKGKKRMRNVGNVEIPQEAFMAVLKLD